MPVVVDAAAGAGMKRGVVGPIRRALREVRWRIGVKFRHRELGDDSRVRKMRMTR